MALMISPVPNSHPVPRFSPYSSILPRLYFESRTPLTPHSAKRTLPFNLHASPTLPPLRRKYALMLSPLAFLCCPVFLLCNYPPTLENSSLPPRAKNSWSISKLARNAKSPKKMKENKNHKDKPLHLSLINYFKLSQFPCRLNYFYSNI